MLRFIIEGGAPGMVLISICALTVFILSIVKAYDIWRRQQFNKRGLTAILFFGSIAPLIGIIWQMIGMMQAFSAIQAASDISPAIIMGGIKLSMYAPLFGLVVLFFSAILWFILKQTLEKKSA